MVPPSGWPELELAPEVDPDELAPELVPPEPAPELVPMDPELAPEVEPDVTPEDEALLPPVSVLALLPHEKAEAANRPTPRALIGKRRMCMMITLAPAPPRVFASVARRISFVARTRSRTRDGSVW
jgi:hypothetical protein